MRSLEALELAAVQMCEALLAEGCAELLQSAIAEAQVEAVLAGRFAAHVLLRSIGAAAEGYAADPQARHVARMREYAPPKRGRCRAAGARRVRWCRDAVRRSKLRWRR